MKAVFRILSHRRQAGAAVRAGAPAEAVSGVVPEVVVTRGHNQPAGRVSAADEKPSHDRTAEKLRTFRTLRGFLLVQIAMSLVLVTIHFGLLIDGYRHSAAGTTESVIAVVLLFGLPLTWTPSPWSRRVAIAVQSFGILGVVVGLFTFALGIGPQTILDLSLNVILLLTLLAGVAVTKRGAWHEKPASMASSW
jgi:hypothetical protein